MSKRMKLDKIQKNLQSFKEVHEDQHENHFRCWIKHDSGFFHFWEITLAINVMYIVFLIPLQTAT